MKLGEIQSLYDATNHIRASTEKSFGRYISYSLGERVCGLIVGGADNSFFTGAYKQILSQIYRLTYELDNR
jgi:hypothetical protein